MKLKLVAVSLGMLGLVSSPVFADTTAIHKHKHHKKHHHTMHHDYKASGAMAMPATPAAEMVAAMPVASASSAIMDQMGQTVGMNKPMPEWFNRIGISGGFNFDTAKWGSRSVTNNSYAFQASNANNAAPYNYGVTPGPKAGYAGENTERFSINNAYLNVTADVNEWTKALAVLSYTDASMFYDQSFTSPLSNNPANFGTLDQRLVLEQANVHFGNSDCMPFYLTVGKQYLDYGRYTVHPITLSMTQVLSETLRNALQLGFVTDMGLNGSVYTFQDGVYKTNDQNNKENTMNYGAAVGYSHPDDQLGYDVGVGYMYNMFGANNVAGLYGDNTGYNGYQNRVGSVAAYADLNYQAFTLGARYTTATEHFSITNIPQSLNHLTTGAKPWALGIQGGFDFNMWARNQNVYLGYQQSHDTVYFNLPHNRYVVGYGVDALKNTKLSAEWDHDTAWGPSNGGRNGGNSNLVSVRAAFKFG